MKPLELYSGIFRVCNLPDNAISTLSYDILNIILLGHVERNLTRPRRGIWRTVRHTGKCISFGLLSRTASGGAEQRLLPSGCNRCCRQQIEIVIREIGVKISFRKRTQKPEWLFLCQVCREFLALKLQTRNCTSAVPQRLFNIQSCCIVSAGPLSSRHCPIYSSGSACWDGLEVGVLSALVKIQMCARPC